jgi:hypothetical protein
MIAIEFVAVMGAPLFVLVGIPTLIEWISERRKS